MAEQGYNLKYTGKEIDNLLDKANDMDSSAQVPAGGTSGQVLTKKSGTNYDAEWETPGSSLPSGGTPSQVLTKKSLTAGDAEWRDAPVMLPSGGNAGQILQKKSSTRNDAGWVDVPSSANPLPAGGSAGQALVKNSSTNYDVKWATIQSGGGGGLTRTILWTNNNPSTEFTPQNAALSEATYNYPLLFIEAKASTASSQLITVIFNGDEDSFGSVILVEYYNGFRRFANNLNSLSFSQGISKSTNAKDNTQIIPLRVIGYK